MPRCAIEHNESGAATPDAILPTWPVPGLRLAAAPGPLLAPLGAGFALLGVELALQAVLKLHQIGRERHAVGLELVELLHDLQIQLVLVLRGRLQGAQKHADLGPGALECHARLPLADPPGASDAAAPRTGGARPAAAPGRLRLRPDQPFGAPFRRR